MKKSLTIFSVLISTIIFAQSPSWDLDNNNKYFQFNKKHVSDDFVNATQIKIGSYLTLGNFGNGNKSWIGNNVLLDYSSYGGVGSQGDKNLLIPVYSNGVGLLIHMNYADGSFKGLTHQWNGLSQQVDLNTFKSSWQLGRSISFFDSKVGIGVENPGIWKLAVNGKIRATEIKVETEWADFVFESGYDLPTIEEVEKFIKANGHLKDIPSASKVLKEGIFLGSMNAKLLQKIEELTLYTIKQQKDIDEERAIKKQLIQKITNQQTQIDRLFKLINELK